MLHYFALVIGCLGGVLLIISSLAFKKARDVFTMSHIVMIANCYFIPLILLAIGMDKFSWVSFAKIIALIFVNLVIVNLLCHAIVKRALLNNIDPQAKIYRSN